MDAFQQSQVEQSLKFLASLVGTYYRELRSEGFNKRQALLLVEAYQAVVLENASDRRDNL